MPTILFPCEIPLWAAHARVSTANHNYRPSSPWDFDWSALFMPLTAGELGAKLRDDD